MNVNQRVQSIGRVLVLFAMIGSGSLGFTPGWAQEPEHATWPAYTMPWDTIPEGALDLSRFLDAPAGKHGFVQGKNGQLAFEDGTRARFWGVNLVAAAPFPNAAQAEFIAERLARAGCNLVRLHHMDAPWHNRPIIDYSQGDSRHLHTENLDRLDRLIAELKERGIYVHLDLLVHRDFKTGDDLPEANALSNGQKHVSYFNRRMIELQKEFNENLLTHVNPYTGLRYAEDPAIAVVMLMNENSPFWTIGDSIPRVYLDEVDTRWNAWLLEQHGSRAQLDSAWTSAEGEKNLQMDEDPSEGTVRRPIVGTWSERYFDDEDYDEVNGSPRAADHFRFLSSVQRSCFDELTSHLRDLGVRCVIAGSNLYGGVWGLKGNARLGVTETDVYYAHPRDGFGVPNVLPDVHISNTDPYDSGKPWGTDAFHVAFMRSRVADAPLLMTEWNQPYPNHYRAESMPFVAAYGAYQDIDGFCLFSYTHADWDNADSDAIRGFFNSGNDPALWGLFTAGALIFHRGDVEPGRLVTDIVYSDADILQPHPKWNERFKGLSYLTRLRQVFVEEAYEGDADLAIASGFTPTADLSAARHAILFSRRSTPEPYRLEDGLELWFQRYIPGLTVNNRGSRRRTFTNLIWTDRRASASLQGFADYPDDSIVDGFDGNGERPAVVLTDRFCLAVGAEDLGNSDPSWEARLTLDCLRHWGLSGSGHSSFDEGRLVSDTGQLAHDYSSGRLVIDTPRTQGVVGHALRAEVRLESVTITPETEFASILCQSLDGKSLGSSRHILITAVGRVENTGQHWSDATHFTSQGGAPVRIEPIEAGFVLITDHNRQGWRGYALAADGSRIRAFDIDLDGESVRWSLPRPDGAGVGRTTDAAEAGAIHFELLFEPSALELWPRHCTKGD